MKKIDLTFAAALGLMATPLLADGLSAEIDAYASGTYSLDELKTAYPDLTEETFSKIDVNSDGEADVAEIEAAQEAGLLAQG